MIDKGIETDELKAAMRQVSPTFDLATYQRNCFCMCVKELPYDEKAPQPVAFMYYSLISSKEVCDHLIDKCAGAQHVARF